MESCLYGLCGLIIDLLGVGGGGENKGLKKSSVREKSGSVPVLNNKAGWKRAG